MDQSFTKSLKVSINSFPRRNFLTAKKFEQLDQCKNTEPLFENHLTRIDSQLIALHVATVDLLSFI